MEGLGLTDSRHLSGVEATDSCLASQLMSDERLGTRRLGWRRRGGNPSHLETASINLPLVSHQRRPQVVSLTPAQSFPIALSKTAAGGRRSEKGAEMKPMLGSQASD